MRTLLVGGTFDQNNGKPSGLISKISTLIDATTYNGGHYNQLKTIINTVINYDLVLWFPSVSNDLPKIRNIKEINNKIILVTSKRNNNEYSKQDIIARALRS